MTTEFYYVVKAVLPITLEEINLLTELSEAHYDSLCKSVGRPGGFLYGMRNHAIHTSESPPEHTMEQGNIDLLRKILEGLQYADKKHWALGHALQRKLSTAFSDISAEWQRLNPKSY